MEEQITIERFSYGKDAIGHTANGKTIFVSGGVPGDIARVHIDEDKPNFCTGHVAEIIEASSLRVPAPCPYANQCGGCP